MPSGPSHVNGKAQDQRHTLDCPIARHLSIAAWRTWRKPKLSNRGHYRVHGRFVVPRVVRVGTDARKRTHFDVHDKVPLLDPWGEFKAPPVGGDSKFPGM